jgi:DDE superfamily endonuclease
LEIDGELYKEAMNRILLGLTVDACTLREMLSVLLLKHEKSNLLKPGHFGTSWAQRFFKRHKLSCRVATTKMREEAPVNFLEKEATYKKVAATYVAKHNVPKALVVGIDETNALFVNRATKQRAKIGAKRIRVIGVGQEKSQITVTLGANEETGELLPTQYIFGGKTTRCHPKDPPTRDGDYFTQTESHWQTPETFMEYLDKVIMPYKEATIRRLGLPVDQKMILKLDLHYSHKDKDVLARMLVMNILPLFVPAGCTDIMQECDTVINKPFKNAMKGEFRDHLHRDFEKFCRENPEKRPSEWAPNLNIGGLKPLMVSFVEAGLRALETPEMRNAIIKAFAEDGRFREIRSDEMQSTARMELLAERMAELVFVPDENEENLEDEEPALGVDIVDASDSDNDDDLQIVENEEED